MVSFVALYRGETVEEAEIIAVSSAPNVVSGFVRGLSDSEDPKPRESNDPERPGEVSVE